VTVTVHIPWVHANPAQEDVTVKYSMLVIGVTDVLQDIMTFPNASVSLIMR